MPQNTHLEAVNADTERLPEPVHAAQNPQVIHEGAEKLARALTWLPNCSSSQTFAERGHALTHDLKPVFSSLETPSQDLLSNNDFRWLYDNGRLLYSDLQNVSVGLESQAKIEHVRTPNGATVPRVLAIAEGFLEVVSYEFSEQEFILFVEVFQQTQALQWRELRELVSALRLVLLEQVVVRGKQLLSDPSGDSHGVGVCVRSLREIGHTNWKDALEPLIVIDRVLAQDPAGAYSRMDFESRNLYRKRLSNIAEHSDCSESEVAKAVVTLAEEARRRTYDEPRTALRESHVGYYLLDKGKPLLHERVRFRPPAGQKIQELVRKHPDEFLLTGIHLLTLGIISAAVLFLTDAYNSLGLILFSMVILFLPSSQSAVQLMNFLITSMLPAEILPKLDFTEGIPEDCVTMVAVPTLLLNEKQVRGLVENLEVRFLGNHDPNIHFALLTDLPDSREPAREDNPLITLCSELIRELNEKYASQNGSFFLFHRHRVYNPREKSWMGWERKRGKLLDLNKLLRGQFDGFPVKVGELSVLPRVRFVLTLDSDTELPRGSAHRMIGTLAHPLNQAIIDPETNTVVDGYGILQPRVGVSVQSTARSRLAAIYAGETGFDIYTRAISDAYQDLYREGSFTGKGIYEVDAVHRVLDRRFPRNSLLSHDLLEGAYARAGLVSDVEVIEDYPSHYSAYNRRKHRWLRGDWQIAGWLLPHVPEESVDRAANPISLISWWKIVDNLRRSLVEPATFLLLVVGWFMPGKPWLWTLVTLFILCIPTWVEFTFNLFKALFTLEWNVAQDAVSGLYASNANLLFTLIFLPHQTLLALDAVVRSLVRRFVTQDRLLEWETAAESELNTRGRTPVDVYLNWMPLLAILLGVLVWVARRPALPTALPILFLWACNRLVSGWLNRAPAAARNQTSRKNVAFLRNTALRTWRYFAEYSTAEHNWLIPDNVQEQPAAIAARVSPTNVGFLLNARQVACEFGYLTMPEFAERTLRTLATIEKLQMHRGHILNWYDTRTLQPLAPLFVSSVDSGNLLASLWTLQQGCMDRLKQPILQPCLAEGFVDYLRILSEARAFPRKLLLTCERQRNTDTWLQSILGLPETLFHQTHEAIARSKHASQVQWFAEEAELRLRSIQHTVSEYAPWSSPEFAALRDDVIINLKMMDSIALQQVPQFIGELIRQIEEFPNSPDQGQDALYGRLRDRLLNAKSNTERLIAEIRTIANVAGKLADGMDFELLLNARRKLVSVGFDVETHVLHPACYDLLATESRTAVFVAIAKEDIPQESWFLLGRAHTLDDGRPVLLSWTGTFFEYLMPSLWMRTYPNTLLERSRTAAVRSQQTYGARKGVPWGISESAYYKLDEAGNYQYYAFGLPHLALRTSETNALVISPYSTFLALNTDPVESVRNLHRMADMGWIGSHGFYEAADFSSAERKFWKSRPQLVRCWMAHHQGMSLLALANFLNDNVVQKWFHAERRVQATELLLHEKPVAHVRRRDMPRRIAAA
jgi:cyclic beta-1,2-glucan synthetase